jgi:hypothetical protein
MPAPTDFEIKCAEECNGGPWPDLSAITFKAPAAPVVVVTRACVRCQRPVTGDRCDLAAGERAEHAGQSPNRRAQVLLDGVVGDPERRGDLRRRPVLAVAEDDARPLARGQGRHRRLDREPLGARVR